jgi:hypothetical protein
MSSFNLLSYPDDLSKTVLVQWLTLKSVVQLDSAFCSATQRPRFWSIANGQECIYVVPFKRKTASIVRWSISRKAKVNGVDIDSLALHDHAKQTEFLAVNRTSLRWISYDQEQGNSNSAAVLLEVATTCHNILKLDLRCITIHSKRDSLGGAILELAESNILKKFKLASKISPPALMQILVRCNSLTDLIILQTGPVQDTLLPLQAAIPTLTYLCTDYIICDAALIAIGGTCLQLKSLQVHGDLHPTRNPVTDKGVAALLQGCLLLRSTNLPMAWTGPDDLRVELAKRCPTKSLFDGYWRGLSDVLAQRVLAVCPSLTYLNLERCGWFTDATLAACARHCRLLETISLCGCTTQCTTAGVVHLIKCSGRLRRLDLAGCTQLHDDVVLAVAQHCPLLEEFVSPPNVGDAACVKLAEGCPDLTTVRLKDTNISDTSLVALAMHCKKLFNLYAPDCRDITMVGIRTVAFHCARLRILALPFHISSSEELFRTQYPYLLVF